MERINASDAKREFGNLLIKAQHSPIGIDKNGKPVAVIISAVEYAIIESIKEDYLRAAIQDGLDDVKAKQVIDGKSVMNNLRKRIS